MDNTVVSDVSLDNWITPGWFLLIALHLTPGILITACYYTLSWSLTRAGIPAYTALMITIAVCLVPVELGIIGLWKVRTRDSGADSQVVMYRHRGSLTEYIIIPILLFVVSVVLSVIIHPLILHLEPQFASWVPKWAHSHGLIQELAYSSVSQRSHALLFGVLFSGLAAPIVEEVYFRGFLLPRMKSMGILAPILNTLLFAVYHFFAPWNAPAIFIAFLPIVFVVWLRKDCMIGAITHCMINLWGVTQVFLEIS